MSIRTRADALLTQTHLPDLLSAHGDAHIVGSYLTDLMVYPDLDFYLDNASLTADAYHSLFCTLIQALRPIRCDAFLDLANASAFIGMETAITGERWNLDLWWKPAVSIHAAQAEAAHMLARMAAQPALKTAALTIKQDLCARKLYGLDKGKQHYHSQEIYDAIFRENILSTEEFLRKHPL